MSLETLEQRRLLASDLVSLADVQELAADAQEIWRSAGATDEQIAALESVQYEVADLGDHKLVSQTGIGAPLGKSFPSFCQIAYLVVQKKPFPCLMLVS